MLTLAYPISATEAVPLSALPSGNQRVRKTVVKQGWRTAPRWAARRRFDGHLFPLHTRYLQLAAEDLGIGADTMKHVAPLGWEHLSFTGDYAWETGDLPGPGGVRREVQHPGALW